MGTGLEGDGTLLAQPPIAPAGGLGVLGRSIAPRAGGPPQRGTARTVPCGRSVRRDGPRFDRLLAPQGIVGIAANVVFGDQGDPDNPYGSASVATAQSTEPATRYHANAGFIPFTRGRPHDQRGYHPRHGPRHGTRQRIHRRPPTQHRPRRHHPCRARREAALGRDVGRATRLVGVEQAERTGLARALLGD